MMDTVKRSFGPTKPTEFVIHEPSSLSSDQPFLLPGDAASPAREVGSRRGSFLPFPAPPSQTGHEVLPHPAFPWAVDLPHSPTPPGLATGPSDPRGSSTVSAVLAVVAAHPARGPSLRRVVLSTPIIATIPSSDFRSTLHHFTGCAYRFRCYRSTRRWRPSGRGCRCRDGSLLFHDGLCDRSAPTTPTGLWCCTSKLFTPSVAFARAIRALHPHVSRSRGDESRRGYRIPSVRTDHLLAAHGDFVIALRQSDLSSRRPSATGPLGRYPGRTLTGKSIAA